MTSFEERTAAVRPLVEARLERALDAVSPAGETMRPPRLLAAMRHAVLGGGKRLRPVLLVESAAMFGRPADEAVLAAAAAVECVHCYSLVHDDLPAMDDDDLRRGRPTVHRAFDEATAILAGDALLTLAFDLLAGTHPAPVGPLVSGLARAAGVGGMVGGQLLDLAAEGRFGDGPSGSTEDEVARLQAMKTGALLRYSVVAGAQLAGATPADLATAEGFGATLGLAFQLADDLLDATAEASTVGKATGKDAAAGKATLVALIGVDASRRRLAELVETAEALLTPFGARAATLVAAARFVAARER